MNLVLARACTRARALGSVSAAFSLFLALAGCAPRVASSEQLAAFNAAGPVRAAVDDRELLEARIVAGPYRLVPGDVLAIALHAAAAEPGASTTPSSSSPQSGVYRVAPGDVIELRMPAVLRTVGEAVADKVEPYECRVGQDGTLWLPTAGAVEVAGRSLSQVEQAVVAAYFPKYVRRRPSVVAQITQYQTVPVSIVGAVRGPGRYELRSDQMSLVTLLMRAGGILREGASVIRLRRAKEPDPLVVRTKGRGIPARDVVLAAGDAVEVEPGLFRDEGQGRPYTCRVSETGTIVLPGAGEVRVAGKALPEAESAVAAAYFPKYAADRPTVVATVAEYQSTAVSIVGGVEKPGRYELRSDEMSLLALLMKAGGVVPEGAGVVRIRHADQRGDAQALVVPVKDLNVPLADVALEEGDIVEVERLDPQFFTVVGLVNRPGTFPYPPDAQYTLQQALAFAGGTDRVAGPLHATVHRENGDGKLLSARFEVGGAALGGGATLAIKPGDVVSLEHTLRTRLRTFFAGVFRVGVYATLPITGTR